MLWHAASINKRQTRRAVTTVYTRSFAKQQIDLTKATSQKIPEPSQSRPTQTAWI